MKGDATCHTTNEKFRRGYASINWAPPSKKESETVVLECGCTVMKGWRCPLHNQP